MGKERLVVGVTGASGAPLAVELLRQLKRLARVETHLICSQGGALTLAHETGLSLEELGALADHMHPNDAIGAPPASGSFRTLGMVVVPCSMKTLAGIVTGYADTLLLRAADVTLKERRRLVLVPRECPLGTLHLRNLTAASELGAVILPPVPAWYRSPQSVADVERQIALKIIDGLGLGEERDYEWQGI